jgi:predicted MPP superfamily phosphohydrolase
MEKMHRWFPEYNYLWPYLNRRTDWNKWQKSKLKEKAIWICYLLMKLVLSVYLKFEFFLLKFEFYQPTKQWKTTATTKKREGRLIFFDVDDTLISKDVRGLKKIKNEISKLKLLGDIFGLNTNRPWSEVKEIYSRLKLNGPVICEGGSYYKLGSKSRKHLSALADRGLQGKIVRVIRKSYSRDARLIVSNDKMTLSQKGTGKIIFITANRKFTVSIYVRNNGGLDDEFLIFLYKKLKKDFRSLKLGFSLNSGKITIDNPMINKIATMSLVRDCYFSCYKVFLISNNEVIDKNWPNINFCGIMRADSDYRKHCFYTADRDGEEGLIQIINNCV